MRQLSEKRIAFNCTYKIGVAEHEKMKKELTEKELKKLKESKEYKNFLMNKNLFREPNQESDKEESEKDE